MLLVHGAANSARVWSAWQATLAGLGRSSWALDLRLVALTSLGPESRPARDERKAGIVVPPLPCPLLVVTGGGDRLRPRRRYKGFPLPAEWLEAPDASHWRLVLARATVATVVPAVVRWLDARAR